jgi:type IV fimbrial biogenesis protein FimT
MIRSRPHRYGRAHQLNERRHARGFTLMQLIITIAIVGVLTRLAVPLFQYVTTTNRIANEINGLLGDLEFARSSAVTQGTSVTVCVSANPTAATPSCSSGALSAPPWTTGWIVYTGTSATTVTAGNLLRAQGAFTGTDTFVANNTAYSVTFNREGYASGLAASGVLYTLKDKQQNNRFTRCLVLTIAGEMSTITYNASASAAQPACT